MKTKKYGWAGFCDSIVYVVWAVVFMVAYTILQISVIQNDGGLAPGGGFVIIQLDQSFAMILMQVNFWLGSTIVLSMIAAFVLCFVLKWAGVFIIWIDRKWGATAKEPTTAEDHATGATARPPAL